MAILGLFKSKQKEDERDRLARSQLMNALLADLPKIKKGFYATLSAYKNKQYTVKGVDKKIGAEFYSFTLKEITIEESSSNRQILASEFKYNGKKYTLPLEHIILSIKILDEENRTKKFREFMHHEFRVFPFSNFKDGVLGYFIVGAGLNKPFCEDASQLLEGIAGAYLRELDNKLTRDYEPFKK